MIHLRLTGVLVAAAALGAAPPSARLGSEERRDTETVSAPIDEVTVYSNRARITRRARIQLSAGARVIRFEQLPPGVLRDSVRVTAHGARIMRAEVETVPTESIAIETLAESVDRLEALQEKQQALLDASGVEAKQLEFIKSLQPAPFVDAKDRDGRGLPAVSLPGWLATAEFFDRRATQTRREILRLERQRRPLDAEINALTRDLRTKGAGAQRQRTVVYAVVQVPATKRVTLTLEYDVHGPTWSPVYDLHFAPEEARLTVFTAAVVRQETGEDWTGAQLHFSTGVPDESIALPRLSTWTLGEKGDFVPEVRPTTRPPASQTLPGPTPARDGPSEALLALNDRLTSALDSGLLGGAMPHAPPKPKSRPTPSMEPQAKRDMRPEPERKRKKRSRTRGPARLEDAPAEPPAARRRLCSGGPGVR